MHNIEKKPNLEEKLQAFEKVPLYKDYVTKILKDEVLKEWIDKTKENEPGILDLISEDWLNTLKNTITYNDYLNNNVDFLHYSSKNVKKLVIYKVKEYQNKFHVLVVGYFKVKPKNQDTENKGKICVVDSIPLNCIASIFCSSLEKNVLFNTNFYIDGCKGLCLKCLDFKSPSNNGWCIQNTLVYNQGTIDFATREYCETLFNKPTKAILNVEINTAYTFGDNSCKVGGTIKTIMFINDKLSLASFSPTLLSIDPNFIPNFEKRKNDFDNPPVTKQSKYNDETGVQSSCIEKIIEETFLDKDNLEPSKTQYFEKKILAIPTGIQLPPINNFEVTHSKVKVQDD